jgi:hypothetical protein
LTPETKGQKIWRRKVNKSVSYHQQWPKNRQFKILSVITGIPGPGQKIEARDARYQTLDSDVFWNFPNRFSHLREKTRATDLLKKAPLKKMPPLYFFSLLFSGKSSISRNRQNSDWPRASSNVWFNPCDRGSRHFWSSRIDSPFPWLSSNGKRNHYRFKSSQSPWCLAQSKR